MGIFESDFDIENYVQQRVPEISNLENRELFKIIVGNTLMELYNHVKEEYAALEARVFDETPRASRLPDLITCVVPAPRYDLTDAHLFPIFPEDLNPVKVDAQEMIRNVNTGKEFFLYSCLIKADYLELRKLMNTPRKFSGTIENEYGETPAQFILKPNQRYLKKLEEFYGIARLNYMPWRALNSAYLHKMFDVYVVSIEDWDDQLEVRKVTTEFDEFSDKVLYEPLPLWNVRATTIKANAYPQPAVDRKYYEHYLFKKQFNEGHEYLLRHSDFLIRNIRWQNGDLYIMCDSDLPGDWDFYEMVPSPDARNYENPLLSNEQNSSFSRDMIEYFGQRIKTRAELVRFFKSFKCSEDLTFVEAQVTNKPLKIETYSTEEFIDYEYRTGDRPQYLEFSFRPRDEDFYLNRDLMSFLVTAIQHLFPEYQCVGKLV